MQAQILIGIGALIIVIGLIWFFIWHRKNNKEALDNSEALLNAIINMDEQRFRSLLKEKNTDINKVDKDGWTPLYFICSGAHHNYDTRLLDTLLKQENIEINKANKDGETPLYTACENGHENIVMCLLENKNININKATNKNETPLSIATLMDHNVIAAILKKKGAK